MIKKLYKTIGVNDKHTPYIHGSLLAIVIISLITYLCIEISNDDIKELSNTIIGVASIFASFLMAGLAIILQNSKNENILLLKKHNKFLLFIRYFKEAICICGLTAIFSILISLGLEINIYTISIFILLISIMIFTNYRIFHFLFWVLEDIKS